MTNDRLCHLSVVTCHLSCVIHFYRYISALTVLLILCSTYALAVAPWFEPPPIARRTLSDEAPPLPLVSTESEKALAGLFPADHWVRNNPKIFETDLCTLFIK